MFIVMLLWVADRVVTHFVALRLLTLFVTNRLLTVRLLVDYPLVAVTVTRTTDRAWRRWGIGVRRSEGVTNIG